jgi:hypothetical protein
MKMKKIIYYVMAVWTLALPLCSCDDTLDPEVDSAGLMLEDDVIYYYERTQRTVNAIYSFLPDGFSYVNGAMLACASDEAEYAVETNSIQQFNTGSWNAVSNPDNAWAKNYQGIYLANLFLTKSDSVNLDFLKYDPNRQDEYRKDTTEIRRWKFEARFLRAFFYSELIKRYGGVPIITSPMDLDTDYASVERNTLSECVQFIVDECNIVADELPLAYTVVSESGQTDPSNEFGRATRGAAFALKSRVLLYAASDLWNDPSWASGYSNPEFISMTDNKTRRERWMEAAVAADSVIRLAGKAYALVTSAGENITSAYATVFRTTNNTEIIFDRRYGSSRTVESLNYPVGFSGGGGGTFPSGNLVDAYEIIQGGRGVKFDWNNAEHTANPYKTSAGNGQRDPRLVESIVTNWTFFNTKGNENRREVEIWPGGIDGKGIPRATRTGYYLKKFLDTNLNLTQGQNAQHTWILFRLGEIYLNYAEACFELDGDKEAKVDGATLTARSTLTALRRRVSMPAVATSITPEAFRDLIRNERRVELAFEDHRLWDVRRWMIAPETLSAPISGVNIKQTKDPVPIMVQKIDPETEKPAVDKDGNPIMIQEINSFGMPRWTREFEYSENKVVENRKFDKRMYFYPIPQKELTIAGWVQNPLW